jgi:hypothetical protein
MSEPRSRRVLWTLVPLVIAVVLGILVGRASVPKDTAGISSAAADIGSAHTPAGAAAAAAAFERSFASPAVLRPGGLRKRIEAAATPAFAKTMLAANGPGAKALAAGPIGEGLARGTKTLYSAVPIGYRIESYSTDHAHVLTWGFTLLGNAEGVEPAAYFGLTHTELDWTADGWKIASTKSGFGPTPRLGTDPGPLGAYDVVDLASELRGYDLAP